MMPDSATHTTARRDGHDQDTTPLTCFVARHPILDPRERVLAYELLFRSDERNAAAVDNDGRATAGVLHNAINVLGLNRLLDAGKAFVNFHNQSLIDGDYRLLPPDRSVIELVESVRLDDALVDACRQLKREGYKLAVNDTIIAQGAHALVAMADFVKVDFRSCAAARRAVIARHFADTHVGLIAEKVQTYSEFGEAMNLGYTMAQGFFFCEPQVVTGRDIPATQQQCLSLVREVGQPQIDYAAVEQIIKADLSLSVKLLHYLNSAAMGVANRIESIRQAVTLLGEQPLRRWTALVAMMGMGADKSPQLVRLTLIRARFCEQCAEHCGMADKAFDLFLVGLLSTLDALLDEPLDDLLLEMPLPLEVKAAMLGADTPPAWLLDLAAAAERGDFGRFQRRCADLQIDPADANRIYQDAIAWAREL